MFTLIGFFAFAALIVGVCGALDVVDWSGKCSVFGYEASAEFSTERPFHVSVSKK